MRKPVTVAVGVILNSEQEVLIAQRPVHAPHGGLWEFPGGKMEPGEECYQALCRELQEEIGIQVISAQPLTEYSHQYPDRSVILSIWSVTEFSGEPCGREGQLVRWVPIADLKNYSFPSGNQNILQMLLR